MISNTKMKALLLLLAAPLASAQTERDYTLDSTDNRTNATRQIKLTATKGFIFRPRRAVDGDRINIYGRNFPTGNLAGYTATAGGVPATVLKVGPRVVTLVLPSGVMAGDVILTPPGQSAMDVGELAVEGVLVSPPTVEALFGDPIQFTAQVFGASSQTVIWEVDGRPNGSTELGTINSAGVYTPPSSVLGRLFPAVITARSVEIEARGSAVVTAACTSMTRLVVDNPISGTIAATNDRHCYMFDAAPGDRMIVGYAGVADARLILRDPSGRVEAIPTKGPSPFIAPFMVDAPGTWLLDVEAADATETGLFTVGVVRVNESGVVHWAQPGVGLFGQGQNWLSGTVPPARANVRASVLGVGTVRNISSNTVVNDFFCEESFDAAGGMFTVLGAGEFYGSSKMGGGFLAGSGSLTFHGPLNWTGGTIIGRGPFRTLGAASLETSFTRTLDDRTWQIEGLTRWTGLGALDLRQNAHVRVEPSGQVDFETSASVRGFSPERTWTNEGTMRKIGATGSTSFVSPVELHNAGLFDVQVGSVRVLGGGSNTGTLVAASGASVDVLTNSFELAAGSLFTGDGTLGVQGNGRLDVQGATTASHLLVGDNGFVSGPGLLTVSDSFTWTGGTLEDTGATIAVDGPTSVDLNLRKTLDGRTLLNRNTLTWTGAGQVWLVNGARLENAVSATFDIQTDTFIRGSGLSGGVVSNAGTLVKSTGNGRASLSGDIELDNTGLVDVQMGTLSLQGGGLNTASMTAASGATVEILGAPYVFGTGSSMSGAGYLELGSLGDLVVDATGATAVTNLRMQSNSFATVNSALSVSGDFDYLGGTISGDSAVTSNGSFGFNGNLAKTIEGGTLRLAGPSTWLGAGAIFVIEGGALEITPTGDLDIQTDRFITAGFNPSGGSLLNEGLIRKSAGTARTTVNTNISFENRGTLRIESGIMTFNGGFEQTAGVTTLVGTEVEAVPDFLLSGGALEGNGEVDTDLTIGAATLEPGGVGAVGEIVVDGDVTLAAASTVSFELEGASTGLFDSVQANGAVAINGTLSVALSGGYVPAVGEQFLLVASTAVSGSFATLDLPAGFQWSVQVLPAGVTLERLP